MFRVNYSFAGSSTGPPLVWSASKLARGRWGVCGALLALLLLSGCASRSSITQFGNELSTLRSRVDDLRRNQEATIRELARTVTEIKDVQDAVGQRQRSDQATASQVASITGKIQENDQKIKGLNDSVQELTQQVAKLSAPPQVAQEKVAEPASPKPAPRSTSPEQLYGTALSTYRSKELGQAVLEFMELIAKFPRHPLAGNAQYWIGEAYYTQRDYRQALAEFQRVMEQYPKGNKAPDALLKIGLSYRALREPGRAQEAWERVIREFPGSEPAKRARVLLDTRVSVVRPAQ